MNIKIIGISGRIGAGKDTLASALDRLSPVLFPDSLFLTVGFANLMKEVVIASFGVAREHAFGTQEDKARPLPTNPDVSIRTALQRIGEAYASLEPGYWVRRLRESVEVYSARARRPLVVAVPDVRFPREVDAMRAWGHPSTVIRLTRTMGEFASSHVSETALDGYGGFDCTIDNREMTADVTLAHAVKHLQRIGWAGKF